MRTSLQLLPLLPLLGASCSTAMRHSATSETTTYGDLVSAYKQPRASFERAQVSCTVVADGEIVKLPRITIEQGRSSQTDLTSSTIFPTDFALPELPKPQEELRFQSTVLDSFPAAPATPIEFEQAAVGWSLNLAAESRNSFVLLRGVLTHVKSGDMIRAEGIPFRPIVEWGRNAFGRSVAVIMTENRAERPVMVTEKIPILIAARSNETHRVYLDASRTTYADFHCVLVPSKAQTTIANPKANKTVLDKWLVASSRNEL